MVFIHLPDVSNGLLLSRKLGGRIWKNGLFIGDFVYEILIQSLLNHRPVVFETSRWPLLFLLHVDVYRSVLFPWGRGRFTLLILARVSAVLLHPLYHLNWTLSCLAYQSDMQATGTACAWTHAHTCICRASIPILLYEGKLYELYRGVQYSVPVTFLLTFCVLIVWSY